MIFTHENKSTNQLEWMHVWCQGWKKKFIKRPICSVCPLCSPPNALWRSQQHEFAEKILNIASSEPIAANAGIHAKPRCWKTRNMSHAQNWWSEDKQCRLSDWTDSGQEKKNYCTAWKFPIARGQHHFNLIHNFNWRIKIQVHLFGMMPWLAKSRCLLPWSFKNHKTQWGNNSCAALPSPFPSKWCLPWPYIKYVV